MVKAGDFDVLGYLWEQMPKGPDDDHITYSIADLELLWQMGFVDTEQFSLEAWRAAFAPFKRAEGYFLLARPDFLALDRYRYKGELYAPFDATLINEGQYTDEGFQELVDQSIAPSCSLARAALHAHVLRWAATMRLPNNLLRVSKEIKITIGKLLEESPSPLRRMELLFAHLFEQRVRDLKSGKVAPTPATLEQFAHTQASTFSMLSTHEDAAKTAALKKIEKSRPADDRTHPPRDGGTPGTPLAKIRRSRRGMRG